MLIFYAQLQWRTEEGVRGLEPFPLAYDLRNKRNRVFSTKNMEKFFGSGHSPLPRPFASGEEDTPSPRPPPSAPAEPRPLPFQNHGYATG